MVLAVPNSNETGLDGISAPEKPEYVLGESTVVGLLGYRRRGKSLLGTFFCANAYAKGARILHNGPLLFGEEITLEQVAQLDDKMYDAILFIDEIQAWLDSARGQTIVNYLITQGLVQFGKRRIWLVYTTQDQTMIPGRLIFQTDIAIYTNGPVSGPWKGRIIPWKLVHQGSLAPRGTTQYGRLWRAERFWNWYDTERMQSPLETMGLTSQSIKQRFEHRNLAKVKEYVEELQQAGVDRVVPGELAMELQQQRGLELGAQQVAKALQSFGFAQKRSHGVRYYMLQPQEPQESGPSALA